MTFDDLSTRASSSPPPHFKNKQYFSRTGGQGGWYCTLCTPPIRAHLESMTASVAMIHERTHAHELKSAQFESWNWKPDLSGWEAEYTPFTDLRQWERQGRVDRLKDFVPFWRDGVLAAERGEETVRMEEFLDRLEEEWQKSNGSARAKNGGWGRDTGEEIWVGGPGDWNAPADLEWGGPGPTWDVPQEKDTEAEWGGGEGDWGVSSERTSDQMVISDGSCAPKSRRAKRKLQHNKVPDRDSWTFVEEVARKEEANAERKRRMHQFFEMPTQKKVQKIEEMVRLLQVRS